MSRTVTLLLLVVVIAFSYFAYFNPGSITLNLWKDKVMELPVIGVVLLSLVLGSLLVLIVFGIRGLRRTYTQVQEKMKKRRREKAEELYNRGVDAHISGKEEQAVKLLEDAVQKDPDFIFPFFRLGNVYLRQGKYDQAIELHQKARAAHPKNLRLLLMLVDDYVAAGKSEEAAVILKEIVRKDDGNRTALTTLRDIQEGQGEWEEAIESQKKLLKLSGKEQSEQSYMRGLKYQCAASFIEKGEHDRAVKLLRDILKESPDFIAAILSQGEAFIAMGKLDDGLKVLIDGYRTHKKPVFLQAMADKLMDQENPRKLIEIYRELLEKMPQDVFLNLFYGKICLRLEMVDDGFMALKKVESLGYDSPLLHALLGESNARRERFQEAIEEFRKFIDVSLGMKPHYQCGNCAHTTMQWSARCESCGMWNTSTLPGLIEMPPPPAAAPRYDSED
ncbi:DUF1049 domain-containing protein [bacterium]|nr:MAG: DUF1049 domain-containing protein [bacterium]